jgi:5-methyltetrahydrofolate--homocysteine methyltransferase
MNAAVAILQPHIKAEATKVPAKVILGVVDGDIHDIGKNLVKILMSAAGFNVIDLGKNVSASAFINAIKEQKPQIVGMSTLMSPTMITMREIIAEFKKQGVRDMVKVIVGGAPISAGYAEEIGADGYEKDAPKAVKLVERLLK